MSVPAGIALNSDDTTVHRIPLAQVLSRWNDLDEDAETAGARALRATLTPATRRILRMDRMDDISSLLGVDTRIDGRPRQNVQADIFDGRLYVFGLSRVY
jgi:hypothetical protein